MPGTDAEVERVLLEIRERLRAEESGDEPDGVDARRREALARIEASLAVAARAWDRLPPVMSDRMGWRARAEVWIKRVAKHATNWFTWEQSNFNAAATDALRSALAVLREQDEERARLHERLEALDADLRDLRQLRTEVERLRRGAPSNGNGDAQ